MLVLIALALCTQKKISYHYKSSLFVANSICRLEQHSIPRRSSIDDLTRKNGRDTFILSNLLFLTENGLDPDNLVGKISMQLPKATRPVKFLNKLTSYAPFRIPVVMILSGPGFQTI